MCLRPQTLGLGPNFGGRLQRVTLLVTNSRNVGRRHSLGKGTKVSTREFNFPSTRKNWLSTHRKNWLSTLDPWNTVGAKVVGNDVLSRRVQSPNFVFVIHKTRTSPMNPSWTTSAEEERDESPTTPSFRLLTLVLLRAAVQKVNHDRESVRQPTLRKYTGSEGIVISTRDPFHPPPYCGPSSTQWEPSLRYTKGGIRQVGPLIFLSE